ncbi:MULTISPECIES: DUF1127 domain-containing protein [Pseudomonas]|uniref:YjiS-like domain-containing protein n=1 Tax=Pseudomonas chlororaphis TaxID=587753 RepID=A0A0D5XSC7_9PSED|nr:MULTISPECIES: DUF1127 domain-containing protein [Pseudomonas]AJO81443.1 hypothetical protein TO66_30770 [Pseudomonas sp. MRSN 12121]AKA21612.1 hypothetical protein PCL1606_01570 [Pseudomonas chlororaphis]MCB2250706.1 DUF1127 domain-containing protein [Pseudomonas chlororaphis]
MNGLSDVRLSLHSQELAAEQERAGGANSVRHAPAGLGLWGLYWHRLRTRKALLELTPEQLRDIGLSREQAREEGLKPFWRL